MQKQLDNTVRNRHSGLTELETAIRNLNSEIDYYLAIGEHDMARLIHEQVTTLEEQLN